MKKEEKRVFFSVDFVNALLEYLGTKPFVEVANLVNHLKAEGDKQLGIPKIPQQEKK